MLQNIHDVDEIVEFIKGHLEKQNGKYRLAMMFGMAQRCEKNEVREAEYEKIVHLSRGERVVETVILNSEIAIVKVENNKDVEVSYHPIVQGKRIEIAETFDYAVVLALAKKYGVDTYAPQAIRNILQMDHFETQRQPKSFVQRIVSGEMTIDQIDDVIEEWHTGKIRNKKLHEYLGLTPYEYQEAVLHNNKKVLQSVIDSYISMSKE